MKYNFIKGVALAALIIQLASPAFANAEERGTAESNKPNRPGQGAFCERIASFGSRADNGMYEREVKLKAHRGERHMKVEEKWKTRDEMLDKKRGMREDNIGKRFEKIESRSLTDAQKSALATFKSTYERAIAARKAAIDSAIATYRDAAEGAIASHQAAVDGLLATFKASVKTAQDKAIADCKSGVDMQTVKTTLITSIQAARAALHDGQKALETRETLKPLIEARNAAIRKATEDFKATIESAKAALKAAFPEKTE